MKIKMSSLNYKYGSPFKFKSLKSYISIDDMNNSTKKYRQVFDKSEIDYLRWELCFYNKLFDEEEWDAEVAIKVIKIWETEKEVICNLKSEIKIEKNENEVKVYQSWGLDPKGGYWQEGYYVVEAFIDHKKIGKNDFYIEDIGIVTSEYNRYFELVSIRLYSGNEEAYKEENKKYLSVFSAEDTQYIWVELKVRNKLLKPWNFEYFINFYDNTGQLKAKIKRLNYINSDTYDKILAYNDGYGSKEYQTWNGHKYTVEVVFMDTLIGVIPFEMGKKDIEYKREIVLPNRRQVKLEKNINVKDAMNTLNSLIGLEEVKKQVQEHTNYIKFLKLRHKRGIKDENNISLHSVFTGNPGTGKTTVVKILGGIYKDLGLLSKGHIVEADRSDLVGEYIGQTAPRVHEVLDKARGGILFIDEAYSLARSCDDVKDYGREVIEILLKEMSDGDGNIAIMVAGYPKKMKTFLDINPGLKSRFNYYFKFEDYTPDELMQIANYAAKKRLVTLDKEASELVQKFILEAYRNKDDSFGNARYAYSLIDEAKMNLGLRLVNLPNIDSLSNDELSLIRLEDVQKIKNNSNDEIDISIPIDEELLRISLDELNHLIGIENIKNEINDTIKLVRYYKETNKDILNKMARHTVFIGNPGTGKTTIARILSKIYKALGLLKRGHLVETAREDLVAGYSGQTAIKTKELLQSAMGGVLFIDEAYSLAGDDYGNEAIEVILKTMEDNRGEFVIIVAGYPDNMDEFLKSNPGLKSRFDRIWTFEDYKPDVLYKIAISMLKDNDLKLNEESGDILKKHIEESYKLKDDFFANARFIRKIVQMIVKNQHLRMASIANRTKEMMTIVTKEDLEKIQFIDKQIKPNILIGFKTE